MDKVRFTVINKIGEEQNLPNNEIRFNVDQRLTYADDELNKALKKAQDIFTTGKTTRTEVENVKNTIKSYQKYASLLNDLNKKSDGYDDTEFKSYNDYLNGIRQGLSVFTFGGPVSIEQAIKNSRVNPIKVVTPTSNFLNPQNLSDEEKNIGKTITQKIKGAENFTEEERKLINKYGLEVFMPQGYDIEMLALNSDWNKKRQENTKSKFIGPRQKVFPNMQLDANSQIEAALRGDVIPPNNQADQDVFYSSKIYGDYLTTKRGLYKDLVIKKIKSDNTLTEQEKAERMKTTIQNIGYRKQRKTLLGFTTKP